MEIEDHPLPSETDHLLGSGAAKKSYNAYRDSQSGPMEIQPFLMPYSLIQ